MSATNRAVVPYYFLVWYNLYIPSVTDALL